MGPLALLAAAALAAGTYTAYDVTTYPDSKTWSSDVANYEWEIPSPCEDVSYLAREDDNDY